MLWNYKNTKPAIFFYLKLFEFNVIKYSVIFLISIIYIMITAYQYCAIAHNELSRIQFQLHLELKYTQCTTKEVCHCFLGIYILFEHIL